MKAMEEINKDIERFLNEEMSDTEAAGFRLKIQDSTLLQKQLESYVLRKKTAEALALKRIQGEVKGGIQEARKKAKLRSKIWRIVGILAIVALLVIAGIKVFNSPEKQEQHAPPELLSDPLLTPVAYLTKENLTENLLSPLYNLGDRKNDSLLVILNALDKEDYTTALPRLEEIPKDHPNYERLLLVRVFVMLRTQYYEEARALLDRDWQNPNLREEAEWLSALQYLLVADKEQAVKALGKIRENSYHAHYQDAKRYLR